MSTEVGEDLGRERGMRKGSCQQSLLHTLRCTVETLVSLKARQACHPVLLGATIEARQSSYIS